MQTVLDWSEVWALAIPVLAILLSKEQPRYLKPVIVYVWFALVVNVLIDGVWIFKSHFPSWLQSNNPFYNIHAVGRFACFCIFFLQLPQNSFRRLKKALIIMSGLFIIINFIFFENFLNPDHLSGNLLAAEAYLLLVYCMQYYLSELRNDDEVIFQGPDFWIVTGLSIYVVTSFFVFLFYLPLLNYDPMLADRMWNFHNIAFIIFCIFITKALYVPVRYQHTI
ncbi:MAG: hypothetical protein ABIY51_05685 [Ferruginibacter sp.]